MTILTQIPFADYVGMPQINPSLLTHAFKSWKQFRHVQLNGFQPKTPTRVGTQLHSMVELLPLEKFQDEYVVMPDYKTSPDNVTGTGKPSTSRTGWVKDQEAAFKDANGGAEVLELSEHKRVRRMLKSVQECPDALDLIEGSQKEMSMTAEMCGIQCKGRMDGIKPVSSILWDLKSTASIQPQAFGRTATNLNYVFKMAFYTRLIVANGGAVDRVFFIAVQDARPHKDGVTWNEAPDCTVIEVPMIAIENTFSTIDRLLYELKACQDENAWPGVASHELYIPNWAMPEEDLELCD
jgi:hypothetical protein